MLSKLLKYDLIWSFKIIGIFHALAIFFAILTRVFGLFEGGLFSILTTISGVVVISMLLNALINGVIRAWVRFIQNNYKDESYLTHTLPVSKTLLFNSKVISAIIVIFETVLVSVLSIFIAFYSKKNFDMLLQSLNASAQINGFSVPAFLISVITLIFIQIVLFIIYGYLSIIIGYKSNKQKFLRSLVIGFSLYIASSLVVLITVLVIGIFNPSIMQMLNSNTNIEINVLILLVNIISLIYLVLGTLSYYISLKVFNQGVNVE